MNHLELKRINHPPIDMVKPLDYEVICKIASDHHGQSGRVLNILKGYRKNNLGIAETLPITEAEAWSLYSLTSKEIEKTTYKELKTRHGLPQTYEWGTFAILHEYFKTKGIIEEDGHFPRPIDFQVR